MKNKKSMQSNSFTPPIGEAVGGVSFSSPLGRSGGATTITRAVRLYGKEDLRLEEFELPAIKADEILAKVVSDSICMSSYKAAKQATDHKRVPNDIAENPIIIGHEFSGELVEIGENWKHKFKAGQKFSIQPAIYYEEGPVGVLSAPGYSYPIHWRRCNLCDHPERCAGSGLFAGLRRARLLSGIAGRTALVRDWRHACQLPHHSGFVRPQHGNCSRW